MSAILRIGTGEDRARIVATLLASGLGAVFLSLSALTWSPGMSPRPVLAGGAALAWLNVLWILVRGRRASWATACVVAAEAFTIISTMSFFTRSQLSLGGNGIYLCALSIFTLWFLPRRAAVPLLCTGCALYLAALVSHGQTDATLYAVANVAQALGASWLLARLRGRLRDLADVDALTGALSRRAFREAAARLIHQAARTARPLSVFVFDLDNLKQINDGLGHSAGDRVLRDALAAVRADLRPYDLVGRIGGDEFAAVLLDVPVSGWSTITERLRRSTPITFSLGWAALRPGATLDGLLAEADANAYRDKRARRGRAARGDTAVTRESDVETT